MQEKGSGCFFGGAVLFSLFYGLATVADNGGDETNTCYIYRRGDGSTCEIVVGDHRTAGAGCPVVARTAD